MEYKDYYKIPGVDRKATQYDAAGSTMYIDWRMSKKGFNLMAMQIPSLNEKIARWLWELADL